MFTHRLIVATLKLLTSVGGLVCLQWLRGIIGLPSNPLRATAFQLLLYCAFGLVTIGVAIAAIYFGLKVWSLLFKAYEIGAKILNEREENQNAK